LADVSRSGDVPRLVGVLGHPIAHSLSPVLHRAAFAAMGLAWGSWPFEVPAGGGRAAVAAVAALGLAGVSVTMPLKEEVAIAVDRRTAVAERLGAVNCVVVDGGRTVGDSTDGDGLVRFLVTDRGVDPSGRRCLVLGAGGAARAVIDGLARAGADEVTVVARRRDRAAHAAQLAGPRGRIGGLAAVAHADLVVNATPVGMGADDEAVAAAAAGRPALDQLPVDPDDLHPGQVVVDLVYAPRCTPLLAVAARQGAEVADGVGMLVHQAALAVERWTGRSAPVEAMWAAVGGPHGSSAP
jgi:shikimate dehydrogenase